LPVGSDGARSKAMARVKAALLMAVMSAVTPEGRGVGEAVPVEQRRCGVAERAEQHGPAPRSSPAWPRKVIEQATLEAWVQYGADFTCGDTWPVTAHWVTRIDSSTTWNSLSTHTNDPAVKRDVKPGPNPNNGDNCSVQSPTWDITDAVHTADANSYSPRSSSSCRCSCRRRQEGCMRQVVIPARWA
jgi:hypothetical protein